MDAILRRERLKMSDNVNARVDYIVTLSCRIAGAYNVDIRYIPDRSILKPDALTDYLEAIGALEWIQIESLGLRILSDLNNELVPRWVQVTVTATGATTEHRVTLEDRQPRWDNPALLARISSS